MVYAVTKGNNQSFLWAYNFLSKFKCGLRWWHDKYPDDIRPHSTLFVSMFGVTVATASLMRGFKC
jgi:hypothetical protein